MLRNSAFFSKEQSENALSPTKVRFKGNWIASNSVQPLNAFFCIEIHSDGSSIHLSDVQP